ncbi:hypothetical protein NE857_03405 [Nocardiopsis exhalans]|uniref:Uncharacterized protein n=1 Tax=Nocardiopsis exhalans TaxID=163604 RepID=A0ABY5D8Q6_9ACTN|nr:hypothetical protein [Nocardiopsis exhalans]USY20717.1 hypothetical protein NE857_03405 [Nocardiopsis exhalans]
MSLQQCTHPVLGAYDLTHLDVFQAAVRPLVGAKELAAVTVRTRPLPKGIKGRASQVRRVARAHGPDAQTKPEERRAS